jgi:23S rRNA pseudouridine1911/1915/1917 synthase
MVKARLISRLKDIYPQFSRRLLEGFLEEKRVYLNGKILTQKVWVGDEDEIQLKIPRDYRHVLVANPKVACRLLGDDDDFIFLEKAHRVHSVALDFQETESVANWLLSIDPHLSQIHPLECGLAHRLDYETSGVMVAARTVSVFEDLKKQFTDRNVEKQYECLVRGVIPDFGLHTAFAGAHRKTEKRVVMAPQKTARFKIPVSLEILSCEAEGKNHRLKIRLITGFRHQIRVQLAHGGCPLVGDELYGGVKAERLMLHATFLSFTERGGRRRQAQSLCPF